MVEENIKREGELRAEKKNINLENGLSYTLCYLCHGKTKNPILDASFNPSRHYCSERCHK
ncbi:MAG: hypothetical protein KKA64_00720 [Nanoarchaeota archaeon]|nr:hypothetical protein [Nanoarchaeota archaeon]